MHFWWLGDSPHKTQGQFSDKGPFQKRCRDQNCDCKCAVHMTYIVLTSFNWSLVLKCQVDSDLWALPGLDWFLLKIKSILFTPIFLWKSSFNHRFLFKPLSRSSEFIRGLRNERHSKRCGNSKRTKIQNLSSIK